MIEQVRYSVSYQSPLVLRRHHSRLLPTLLHQRSVDYLRLPAPAALVPVVARRRSVVVGLVAARSSSAAAVGRPGLRSGLAADPLGTELRSRPARSPPQPRLPAPLPMLHCGPDSAPLQYARPLVFRWGFPLPLVYVLLHVQPSFLSFAIRVALENRACRYNGASVIPRSPDSSVLQLSDNELRTNHA